MMLMMLSMMIMMMKMMTFASMMMMMHTLMMGETVSGARGDTPRTPHDEDDAHVDDG